MLISKNKRDSGLESLLHSEHQVKIEKMAVGGAGVARIDFNDKKIVLFVDRAAPGDELKVKITSVEKNYLTAELVSIIEPSAFRRKAPCVYFEKCGGCSWQHIVENEQIRQKENLLRELLKKFIPAVNFELEPTVQSENLFYYRNRIQLKQLNGALGYFQNGTHQIVDIESCLIADKTISDQIKVLKSKLKPTKDLQKFELRLNQNNQFESYRIGDKGAGLAFSQVNNSVNQKLIEQVRQSVSDVQPNFLTELYAGSGNFTFVILENNVNLRIESVEMNPELTEFATQKIKKMNLQKRLFAFTSDCESFVERRALSSEIVLLDPPRPGVSESVMKKIALAQPKNLLYISCHPVSLARDLQRLLQKNSCYKIEKIKIFDMFPQTDHFETFVHLVKIES